MAAMWLATKLGHYSIVQTQPPDDGDAAVYEVRAQTREELDSLLQMTGLHREISPSAGSSERYSIVATQRELFEIMSTLVDTIDYDRFEPPRGAKQRQACARGSDDSRPERLRRESWA